MMWDRSGTVAQGLFIYQFLPILYSNQATAPLIQPRLDRDGGIAYLAENVCGGPLGEGIFQSSAPSSLGRLMVEHEQPASIQNNRHHRLS
jgi:hypothetical protein